MKNINFLWALLVIAVATGCGNASEEEKTIPAPATITTLPVPGNNTTVPVNTTGSTTTTAPVTTTNTQVSTPSGQIGKENVISIDPAKLNKKTEVNVAPSATTGLNPAHGQPGHRCDISVGAPLNSKPSQPVVTNPNPQVVTPTQAPATAQPIVAAPGMNPQHGQPGHRCDIAVGAPLNSKPAQ